MPPASPSNAQSLRANVVPFRPPCRANNPSLWWGQGVSHSCSMWYWWPPDSPSNVHQQHAASFGSFMQPPQRDVWLQTPWIPRWLDPPQSSLVVNLHWHVDVVLSSSLCRNAPNWGLFRISIDRLACCSSLYIDCAREHGMNAIHSLLSQKAWPCTDLCFQSCSFPALFSCKVTVCAEPCLLQRGLQAGWVEQLGSNGLLVQRQLWLFESFWYFGKYWFELNLNNKKLSH